MARQKLVTVDILKSLISDFIFATDSNIMTKRCTKFCKSKNAECFFNDAAPYMIRGTSLPVPNTLET